MVSIRVAALSLGMLVSGGQAMAQSSFDGFYAGLGGGGMVQDNRASAVLQFTPTGGTTSKLNLLAGSSLLTTVLPQGRAFAGYNGTFGRWLVGAEMGYAAPVMDSSFVTSAGDKFTFSRPYGTMTATARGGYMVQPDLMVYGFAGWAGEQQKFASTILGRNIGNTQWSNGYTFGAGVEYALTAEVFLRAEMHYTEMFRTRGAFSSNTAAGSLLYNTQLGSSSKGGTLSIGYRF